MICFGYDEAISTSIVIHVRELRFRFNPVVPKVITGLDNRQLDIVSYGRHYVCMLVLLAVAKGNR